jgi:hypothetical protein
MKPKLTHPWRKFRKAAEVNTLCLVGEARTGVPKTAVTGPAPTKPAPICVSYWPSNRAEHRREYHHEYRRRNPERWREYSRENSRKHRGLPQPTRPLPGHCENCERPAGKRALSLDHSHVTGQFRGWLCDACNRGIGYLGDSIEGLQRAIDYLRGGPQGFGAQPCSIPLPAVPLHQTNGENINE